MSSSIKDKIIHRVDIINKSFPRKLNSNSAISRKAAEEFLMRFKKREVDTLYKHIPDYVSAKFDENADMDDYVVNVGVWQEYIVKEWFEKISLYDIVPTERSKDFFELDRKTQQSKSNKKSEKIQCRELKYAQNGSMGVLLDFQVPLKASREDSRGELDLVSRQDKEMVLIEYKIPDSTEPLLRAVLEAITYFHQIDGFNPERSKYLQSFNETFFNKYDKSTWCDAIGLAIVVPKIAYIYGHKCAYELIEKYHIKCYTFCNEHNFEDIIPLSEDDITKYRTEAEENLQGIYQNSELIISKIKLI